MGQCFAHRDLRTGGAFAAGLLCLICTGCGGAPQAEDHRSARAKQPERQAAENSGRPPAGRPPGTVPPEKAAARPGERTAAPPRRSLADLMDQTADSAARFLPEVPRLEVDQQRVAAEGIRRLLGERLTLYTDLPAAGAGAGGISPAKKRGGSPAAKSATSNIQHPTSSIDVLPEVFDQAFPQWCDYFGLDPAEHADWRCTAVVMQQKDRFRRAGLLPDTLPPFPHGYSRNFDFWLYEQPSAYYRRHLLLHEGTHSFMNTLLGACGPPWYMEGVAELLATHEWSDGKLTLNVIPPTADAVPHWGRVKLIRDAFAQRRAMRLRRVIEYPLLAHRETEPYAWCWAAAVLLDRHPAYRDLFRGLSEHVTARDFNRRFYRAVGDRWDDLAVQWQVLIDGMDYGYDVARNVIDFTAGRPLPEEGARVTVRADRGWQNSGWRLEAGRTYRLAAEGRYQVANQPRPWPCEPGGVTLRYHAGRPLGLLLAAVHPPQPTGGVSPLLHPQPIGLGTTWTPGHGGTLMLKINDSSAELDDNAGELIVRITVHSSPG